MLCALLHETSISARVTVSHRGVSDQLNGCRFSMLARSDGGSARAKHVQGGQNYRNLSSSFSNVFSPGFHARKTACWLLAQLPWFDEVLCCTPPSHPH